VVEGYEPVNLKFKKRERNYNRHTTARLRSLSFMKWLAGVIVLLPLFALSQSNALPGWHLRRTLELKGPTHHVQGIEFDSGTLWVTSVDSGKRKGFLQAFSVDSGEMFRDIEIQDGERFHPGGIAADGDSLWIPVAEYRANSSSVVEKRDKKSLRLTFQFAVADHIGCIAVVPGFLIGGNWDSRDFYVWDHKGKLIRKVASDTNNAYQDMKFDPPFLVGSGLLLNDRSGAIDWLEWPAFRMSRRLAVGSTDGQIPLTREGMAIHDDQLLLLPEDEHSRLFVFTKGE